MDFFLTNQKPFYTFAHEVYPGNFQPSPCHRFIAAMEQSGKLLRFERLNPRNYDLFLRNYTQNIDTLEQVAGINNVIECHGSFRTATCTLCDYKVTCDDIKPQIMAQVDILPVNPAIVIFRTKPGNSVLPAVRGEQ